MTLLSLYRRAEEQGIEIDDVPMRQIESVAYPEGWIALDSQKIETRSEEKVVLAHEIGHIETGSFYNVYSRFDLLEQHENRADKRAIQMLMPIKRLKRVLRAGIRDVWELAEYFGVTEDFVEKAMELYEDQLFDMRCI